MDTVKKFGVRGSVGALMILAMIASWGNVYAYLAAGHTNTVTTAALATALGVGLVVAAHGVMYYEARLSVAYVTVCTVTAGLAAVTGMIQSIGYLSHYPGMQPYILGYGIPFLLEVGLPLFAKALEKEQARRVIADMQDAITNGTMAAMSAAARTIDSSLIESSAQKEAQRFARVIIRNTFDDLYADIAAQRKNLPQIVAELERNELPEPQTTQPQIADMRDKIAEVNDLRRSKAHERRAQLVALVAEGGAKLADVMQQFGVAENTIRNDVRAMAEHLTIRDGMVMGL